MRKWFVTVVVFCLAALVCAPVVLVLFGSLKSGNELADSLRPVLSGAAGAPVAFPFGPITFVDKCVAVLRPHRARGRTIDAA